MEWIDFATRGERKTLAAIEARRVDDNEAKRRIYDRCRKRMDRKTKAERETAGETDSIAVNGLADGRKISASAQGAP